jgi:Mg/Co/Ni transporter MgtE
LINPVWPIDTLQLAHDKVERFRQVRVMDEERLAGILTHRDKRQQLAHTHVDTIMSIHPFSVLTSEGKEKAANLAPGKQDR